MPETAGRREDLFFRDVKQLCWPARKKLKGQDLPVKVFFSHSIIILITPLNGQKGTV